MPKVITPMGPVRRSFFLFRENVTGIETVRQTKPENGPQKSRMSKLHAADSSPFLRDDLEPVVVWIFAKVNVHLGVFVADAAHLLMAGMGGFVIIDLECQVKFVVAEIVRLLAVSEPGQFQLVRAVPVLQIDDDEAPVLRLDPPHFVHVKGITVEFQALFKVEHVEVVVYHPEFHAISPLHCAATYSGNDGPSFPDK